MSSREGRVRPHRDHPARSDEKSHHGRGINPPSRHLWIGNIPHDITESALAHYFLRFGELESVAFQPGRSYAFINYKYDEDAFAAIEELQGFVIGGNPLRIEFTKAEKAYPMERESPSTQNRDSSALRSSHEPSYRNKSKNNNKDAEPSEVLWIGFPASLKVDEFLLRKAFSPFGEIEKITVFPGRTYAFVRYRNLMAACKAKEILEGKLFGNPHVRIYFSKNESGTSDRERISTNAPPSPHELPRLSENFRSDRNFHGISENSSTPFIPNLDHGDRRLPGNTFGLPDSPWRDTRDHFRAQNFSRQGQFNDDLWDLPEDVSLLHNPKKLKSNLFPPENELLDYPLSDLEKVKHFDKNLNFQSSGDGLISDRSMNTTRPFVERGDNWSGSIDNFQRSPLPSLDRRGLNIGSREASSKVVWRWEGMIAKGGNPVCRARCFPVGKPMDTVLPNFLDCTARTSLDMLAKHYYQASNAWVVFFVPANDPDIAYYNEFMSILGEKQRAAVAKLNERTTLFVVPPSEFSEKILKVPGKLSLSGVILQLDPQGSSHGTFSQYENNEIAFSSFHNKPTSPAQQSYLPAPPPPLFSHFENHGNLSSGASHHDYVQKPPAGPIWSNHDLQTSNHQFAQSGSMGHHHTYSATRNDHTSEIPFHGIGKWPVHEKPHHVTSSMPPPGIGAKQLAQLASSLLGQKSQCGGISTAGEYVPPSGNMNQSAVYSSSIGSQNYGLPNDQHVSSGCVHSDFGQIQQQQSSNYFFGPQGEVQAHQVNQQGQNREREAQTHLVNQQMQNGGEDEADGDPQKRLQATLQLAAALLQQIHQGKGN